MKFISNFFVLNSNLYKFLKFAAYLNLKWKIEKIEMATGPILGSPAAHRNVARWHSAVWAAHGHANLVGKVAHGQCLRGRSPSRDGG
jgi:hypothetical protein